MGFVDKVKQQAAVATAVAKDTAQKGQAKIDEVQAKMAADGASSPAAVLRDIAVPEARGESRRIGTFFLRARFLR